MEPAMRFELMTSSLPRRRSTPELRGRYTGMKDEGGRMKLCSLPFHPSSILLHPSSSGAGDEIRTRDPQLGRLMLYQLSYTRPFKTKDEGGGMKDEKMRCRNFDSSLIPQPSSLRLVQGVGFEPT